jgi:hypothetical protein
MSQYQKNPAYKNVNSSSMMYSEAPNLVKVMPLDSQPLSLPPKNPAYKNVNSSSMIYSKPSNLVKVMPLDSPNTEEERVSLPPKNPGYKNVNSSSMKYVESSTQTSEPDKVSNKEPIPLYGNYNYCSIH